MLIRRTSLAGRLDAVSVRTLVCIAGICLALFPAIVDADDLETVLLAANDLIWDPGTQMIYASVPGSAGAGLGNTITAINSYTGAVGLSLSRFLYVALGGVAAVRRVDL